MTAPCDRYVLWVAGRAVSVCNCHWHQQAPLRGAK
jgi:hypothetical protein